MPCALPALAWSLLSLSLPRLFCLCLQGWLLFSSAHHHHHHPRTIAARPPSLSSFLSFFLLHPQSLPLLLLGSPAFLSRPCLCPTLHSTHFRYATPFVVPPFPAFAFIFVFEPSCFFSLFSPRWALRFIAHTSAFLTLSSLSCAFTFPFSCYFFLRSGDWLCLESSTFF